MGPAMPTMVHDYVENFALRLGVNTSGCLGNLGQVSPH